MPWSEEDDVVFVGDEVQGAQVGDQVAFEASGVVEVELLQRGARRRPHHPKPEPAAPPPTPECAATSPRTDPPRSGSAPAPRTPTASIRRPSSTWSPCGTDRTRPEPRYRETRNHIGRSPQPGSWSGWPDRPAGTPGAGRPPGRSVPGSNGPTRFAQRSPSPACSDSAARCEGSDHESCADGTSVVPTDLSGARSNADVTGASDPWMNIQSRRPPRLSNDRPVARSFDRRSGCGTSSAAVSGGHIAPLTVPPWSTPQGK